MSDNDDKLLKTTELIRTDRSWDGVELPDYPQGRPELVAIKYEIPAGQKLNWHHHPVMNCGILVQGELTIVSEDGTEKVLHEGEAVVEMVGTVHHGNLPCFFSIFHVLKCGSQVLENLVTKHFFCCEKWVKNGIYGIDIQFVVSTGFAQVLLNFCSTSG